MTKTLIMTVGLPRSGKSTWAIAQQHPVVCPDAIRMALYGQPFIATAESIIWAHAKLMVASLFEAGHDVAILDATNLQKKHRDEWVDKRWEIRYALFTDIPKEVCVERAIESGREYLIPVIERMAATMDLNGIDEGFTWDL